MMKLVCRFGWGIFLLLSVAGLFSCGKDVPPYPFPMIRAEKVMRIHPDSALAWLEPLRDTMAAFPEATRMYYELLYLKARDKCYITHTSDSVIQRIVRYYESTGERDKLMEAYYYMGRVYRDMHDSPRALSYFQQALKLSEGSTRYDIISLIYSQTGTLYAFQHVYDAALEMYKKRYEYQVLNNDTMGFPYALRDIARIYKATDQTDSALFYYQKAYDMAFRVSGGKKWYNIPCELSGLYLWLKDYDNTYKYASIALADTAYTNYYPTYSVLGGMYLELGRLDSAFYYLDKTLESEYAYLMQAAYRDLSVLEEKRRDYKEAVHYNNLSRMWEDSVKKITAYETIRQMRELYNYQKSEDENRFLKSENEKRQVHLYQLVWLFTVLAAAGVWFFNYEKKKKNRLIEKEKRLRRLHEAQYKQSQAYITENEMKIKQLENQLQTSEEQRNTIRNQLLEARKELLENTNRQIALRHKEKALLAEDFKRSDIYVKFHLAASSGSPRITENDWQSLQKGIDEAYANFTHTLYSLYPSLSVIELRICYLVKISVKVTGISYLLGRSKSSVSTARNRLYLKLTGREGTPENLDAYIREL